MLLYIPHVFFRFSFFVKNKHVTFYCSVLLETNVLIILKLNITKNSFVVFLYPSFPNRCAIKQNIQLDEVNHQLFQHFYGISFSNHAELFRCWKFEAKSVQNNDYSIKSQGHLLHSLGNNLDQLFIVNRKNIFDFRQNNHNMYFVIKGSYFKISEEPNFYTKEDTVKYLKSSITYKVVNLQSNRIQPISAGILPNCLKST